MRITRTQCAVHSRDANHKDTVRSALKSCGSEGHNTLCTQELRITRTQCAGHSGAYCTQDLQITRTRVVHSRARGSQGDDALCTQELRSTRTRCAVHSRSADHKDTVRSALKSCGSQGHSA
ncbi:hypothetical protein NDU88_006104 [Pleurodeles waltl]|uniref:Uncharacterized protein n=1 Tax=Pleurodeles waltl TaxID=8319 RepID=A0AAV7L359_PLEWA|nr:hypothetical protein NDU88_006104 [Pleurodeles waltl]